MQKKTPSRFVNFLFLLVALFSFVYYLLNGFLVRFGQSVLWLWPLIGAAFLARFLLVNRMIKTSQPSPLPRGLLKGMHAVLLAFFLFFAAVEGVIMTGAFETAPENLDYILVLGAKVNGTEPSGALRNRIEVAAEYLAANPGTRAIASGGQGADEGISEAQCILNGLTARGIDPGRVILEDKSTTTQENMRFSFTLIEEADARVGIVTNNFHMFRALHIAKKTGGFSLYGLPVATTMLSFPHYMLREFLAVVVDTLHGNLAF